MSTPSVFPLEIYEHILELVIENAPEYSSVMLCSFCYVCTAWRWKCQALGFRNLMLYHDSLAQIHMMRKKFVANPHLAAFVENVELSIPFLNFAYPSIIESFPSVLGRFLPRLRKVTMISSMRPLSIHRHFSIRRILLHTVTVLEVSHMLFNKNFTLEWLIAPFPSLRTLDLWRVAWEVPPDLTLGLPPLTDLALGVKGGDWHATWMKENRDAYERLLNVAGYSLRSLSINIFSLHILTSFHDYKSDVIYLNALEVLNVELHARSVLRKIGKDGKELPYRQCVGDIASLLSRIESNEVRVLNFSFDAGHRRVFTISEGEFLESLRSLRQGLEDLVRSKHFPALKTINIVIVGAGEAVIPFWEAFFNSNFPVLVEQGLLHVKEYIPTGRLRHRI